MSVKLEIIEELVHAKPLQTLQREELPDDVADWPESWHEEFEERAAIMEYDGELPRVEAEQWAETIVRAAYHLHRE